MKIKIPSVDDLLDALGAQGIPDVDALDESTKTELTLRLQAEFLSREARAARISKQPEIAIQLLLRSLMIEHSLKNESGIASDLGNLGALYFDVGQLNKAEITLKKALDMDEQAERQIDMAINLYWLGQVEIRKKRFDEAHKLVGRSFQILSSANHNFADSAKELLAWIEKKLS
jgi:tetratricopeptide (TPR) repeat protein